MESELAVDEVGDGIRRCGQLKKSLLVCEIADCTENMWKSGRDGDRWVGTSERLGILERRGILGFGLTTHSVRHLLLHVVPRRLWALGRSHQNGPVLLADLWEQRFEIHDVEITEVEKT
jgi:hypothetical protein